MKIARLWERINHLVPEPSCQTFGDDTSKIVWKDSRKQPTAKEISDVTDEEIDAAKNAQEAAKEDAATELTAELVAMTPDGIESWVDVYATDLTKIREILRALARAVAALSYLHREGGGH